MELLDVIDEEGNVLYPKERKEIYRDGDLHRTVHIWVINSNKEILVQKRSPKKDTFPNLWAISTAGHVKSGETNVETALRELKEELGLVKKEEDLEYLFSIRRRDVGENIIINTIDDVYLVNADIDVENTKLQISELTDIKFVYYEYLEQIYKNNDPEYVPRSEEHIKLFKVLHDRFDEHDSIGVLYKTETEHTYTEFSKLFDYTSRKNTFSNILTILFVFAFISSIALYEMQHDVRGLITTIVVFLAYIMLLIFIPKSRCKAIFDSDLLLKNFIVEYIFYEKYFVIKTKQMKVKVFYGQLYKIVETNDNYYLYTSIDNIYIITKNNIDSSFNSFIKSKVSCDYKRYGIRR